MAAPRASPARKAIAYRDRPRSPVVRAHRLGGYDDLPSLREVLRFCASIELGEHRRRVAEHPRRDHDGDDEDRYEERCTEPEKRFAGDGEPDGESRHRQVEHRRQPSERPVLLLARLQCSPPVGDVNVRWNGAPTDSLAELGTLPYPPMSTSCPADPDPHEDAVERADDDGDCCRFG